MARATTPADKPPTLREIQALAANSGNIVQLGEARKKARRRGITRPQIETCVRKGTIEEGPFRNERGDWQVTLCRRAAGEELRVVVILKDGKILVRSNH
jgi:hypothetical protein